MPRPPRINFENAHYHVTNRGRDRQNVFHGDDYYHAFLVTLEEASNRFQLEVIAYCLLGNQYHLFLKTPLGNLDRCMRHINGLYTQRYNRLKKTDGPLFRGRYKSILVQAESYGLQLSRYIHRSPIELKKPLVNNLSEYKWSSYPAYINQTKSPAWLQQDELYNLLGSKQRYASYRRYNELGLDEEIIEFYGKGNQAAILGDDEYIKRIKLEFKEHRFHIDKTQGNYPSVETIIQATAKAFEVDFKTITKASRGRGSKNIPRWAALYLCRELSQTKLSEIVKAFGIEHTSGVSSAVYKLQATAKENQAIDTLLKKLIQELTP